MTTLYNCMTDGDNYRITKFDDLGNPESSYLVDHETCQCPAGERHTCRHREMLPLFLKRNAVNTFWFYDFDRGGWVTNESAPQALKSEPESSYESVDEDNVEIIEPSAVMGTGLPHLAGVYAKDVTPSLASEGLSRSVTLPETQWRNDMPEGFAYNPLINEAISAIADTRPHSPTVTTTDFDSVDSGSIPLVAAKPAWRRI